MRLRLDEWREGGLNRPQWPRDKNVVHPEVTNRQGKQIPVGSALYLGYGPLTYDPQGRTTTLKAKAAINAGEQAILCIVFPTHHGNPGLKSVVNANVPRLEHALWLMDRFGTAGGRSRNGWGSFELVPVNGTPVPDGTLPLRSWTDCLTLDWAHAVGKDDKGPLIWQTQAFNDWNELVKELAQCKIGLRTQFLFAGGYNVPIPEDRHWLSYPVTKHSVKPWGNKRLPNTLRFKVRRSGDRNLVGVIFHVPHRPPVGFHPDDSVIRTVWARVHRFLDSRQGLKRVGV